MTDISRRGFLGGVAAAAAVAALPATALPAAIGRCSVGPPVFAGCIGVYDGVIIRHVADISQLDMVVFRRQFGVSSWA